MSETRKSWRTLHLSSLNQHTAVLALGLLCLIALLGVWTMRVHRLARRLEARLDDVLGGLDGSNTAQLLAEYVRTVRSTAGAVQRMQQEHDGIAAIMPSVVRHVGLVRFSPFHDTGGDQSFALALLDGQGDGVVVTGLHSRNDSRLYAKPIARGSSAYSLIPEEREAMERAFNPGAVETHS